MLMESLLLSASAIGQGIGCDNEKREANGKEEIKVVENLKRRVNYMPVRQAREDIFVGGCDIY